MIDIDDELIGDVKMRFKIPLSILRYALLLCLVLGVTAQSAFAQGRMIIKPFIETGWQSDSNFHKSDTNEKQVYTYNVKPGFEFGYTTDKSKVSLNYYADILWYDDRDTIIPGQDLEADEFDYTAHNALLRAESQISDRLLIGLDNRYLYTRDPANADANANAVDRFKYYMNTFTPRMMYRFGEKFGLGLKYTNLKTDYSDDGDDEGEDSDENRGTFTFFYYFTPKTSFNLDYQLWTRDYDKKSVDYDSHQVMVNVKHQFNYLTFGAGAGYQSRDFDKTVPSGDIDQFVWKVSVAGRNSSDTARVPKSSMYLSFGSNLNDSGSGDTYYNSTRFDAKFTYLLMEKTNWTLAGWFQNSDYETSARDDDRWLLSLGADYLINDFFSVGLEGGMEDRDSNFAGKDFDNNYVMFNVRFNYDLGSK